MHSGLYKSTIRTLVVFGFALTWLVGSTAQANPKVKQATSWYLKGNNYLNAGENSKAVAAFRKAYRLLPRHPHFNCHRAQFLNYMGRAYERMRQPRTAMTSYYTAAYRSRCKTSSTRSYAAKRYRYLYGRWMCSIQFKTTPPKSRIYQITPTGDKLMGRTPYKKVFSPGKYSFKIRLYDHRTIYYKVDLRPGRHLKKTFKMVKGDDPITRVEKVDIAPPIPMARLKNGGNSTNPNKVAVKKGPEKINLGSFANAGSSGLDTGKKTGNGQKNDLATITSRRKIVKDGPPVYKQAWFWAVIGGVAVAAVVIPIVVPKEQKALISQGKLF